ncbi:nucleotide exchange factor GrpE [Demequina sp.]|uniref:nucleotide exchange factor GrpE n=1 Tax=Demequina sp. TaxID=2050685 RepID=UPI003D1092BA
MNDHTGFNTPDDEGAEDALSEAASIIDGAASVIDANHDGEISADEIATADEAGAFSALDAAQTKAAEHLADLQRLQAEYVNYRKRVDRDRAMASELATARTVEALIPTLDDLAAAREHGDLEDGPFAAIAAKLEAALGQLGWSSFGAVGDAFDPVLHEALLSQPSADVTEPTITTVAQPGHRIGERVLRPARVIVAQPE